MEAGLLMKCLCVFLILDIYKYNNRFFLYKLISMKVPPPTVNSPPRFFDNTPRNGLDAVEGHRNRNTIGREAGCEANGRRRKVRMEIGVSASFVG